MSDFHQRPELAGCSGCRKHPKANPCPPSDSKRNRCDTLGPFIAIDQECLPPPEPDVTCDFRPCLVDASCGGAFPCPPPSGNTLTVGTGPGFDSPTIQAAITAAMNGDTILVSPGTYPEQLLIPTGTNNLTIMSEFPQAAIITPPPGGLIGNLSIVTINGLCTRISGFTITGPATIPDNIINGIFITNNGTAVIDNNFVTNIRNNPLTGSQRGHGIHVTNGAALIVNNSVTNYQKTGIRIVGDDSCSTVFGNTVTGVGATPVIAQNGILFFGGATGIARNNTVTGNSYTGPEDVVSTGILLFQEPTPASVCVEFNRLSSNDVGLYLVETVGSLVQGNNSSNNTQIGIAVDAGSFGNVFIRNTALGNPVYNFEDDSVGFLSAMTGNIYLCNTCTSDNKNGAICASKSPFPTTEPTTETVLEAFLPGRSESSLSRGTRSNRSVSIE